MNNLIYVTGGKQGSLAINKIVFASIDELTKKYIIVHQTGHHQAITHKNYSSFEFDSQKAIQALQEAEIVISRAGAHTIYELAVLGKKSVLIPLPHVSHHEQDINAGVLVDAGLAIVLPEPQLTTENLLTSIDQATKLVGKPLKLPLDATDKMAKLVESIFA